MAALAGVVLLAACGAGGPAQPPGSIAVNLSELRFDPSTITVPHGKVVFSLVNADTLAHGHGHSRRHGHDRGCSGLISSGDAPVFTVNDIAAGAYTSTSAISPGTRPTACTEH